MERREILAVITFSVTTLAGCGGGGYSSPPPPVMNQAVGGIWNAQVTANGVTANVAILSADDGRLFSVAQNQNNGCLALVTGNVTATGSSISGATKFALATYSFTSGTTTGCVYPDGSNSGTGTFTGTVVQRSTLTITSAGTTSLGNALPSSPTFTATFNTLYNRASSLATIGGNWIGPSGVVMNINSNGVIFAQDPTDGCVINGQVSIINASYNAYSLSATYSNCAGAASALNGLTATGLGAVDDTVVPNALLVGYSVVLGTGETIIVAASATR